MAYGVDIVYMFVYVDDILLTSSNMAYLMQLVAQLNGAFGLQDLGYISYFLRLKIRRTDNAFHLNQYKYVNDLLRKFEMKSSKPCSIFMKSDLILSKTHGVQLIDSSL